MTLIVRCEKLAVQPLALLLYSAVKVFDPAVRFVITVVVLA
jgi:hypothetical protein